ncbi:MAG: RnfABCDGE type electron transport complex subunit D [Candidatus Sumerlaeota bacterium]
MIRNPLRVLFDDLAPYFEKNKFLRPFKTLFEATDTFFFSVKKQNTEAPFIRDGVDMKRYMITVILALVPAILCSFLFFGPYVLSMILVSYICGGLVEVIFAIVRKHEINEGFLVSGMLLPLILPVSTPLWVVGIGMAFGVLFGKEVFGGTGHNPLNPALVGRCFIFLAWPKHVSPAAWVEPFAWAQEVNWTTWLHPYAYIDPMGWLKLEQVSLSYIFENFFEWIIQPYKWMIGEGRVVSEAALNAVTEATPYSVSPSGDSLQNQVGFWPLMIGNVSGSVGETSKIAILLGGFYLMFTRVSNWRNTVSLVVGAWLMGAILYRIYGPQTLVPGWFGALDGGLLFCAVYMITDPVSGPATNPARYVYGFMAGALIVVGRAFGPFPGWITFAVLLMNLFAPLLDQGVWAWRFRRLKQCRIQ